MAHPRGGWCDKERTFFQVRVHFLLSIRGGPIAVVSIVHANVLLIADFSFLLSVVVVVVIVVVFTHFPGALEFPIFDDFVPIFHVRSMSLHFVRAENNTRWRLQSCFGLFANQSSRFSRHAALAEMHGTVDEWPLLSRFAPPSFSLVCFDFVIGESTSLTSC